jgi:hypothetical protein
VTDSGIAHLSTLAELQYLNLFKCNHLTDSGIAHLSGLTALQHIDRFNSSMSLWNTILADFQADSRANM